MCAQEMSAVEASKMPKAVSSLDNEVLGNIYKDLFLIMWGGVWACVGPMPAESRKSIRFPELE